MRLFLSALVCLCFTTLVVSAAPSHTSQQFAEHLQAFTSKYETLPEAGAALCSDFAGGPSWITTACTFLIDIIVPFIEADFAKLVTPDITCEQTLGACTGYEQCKVYGQWPPPSSPSLKVGRAAASSIENFGAMLPFIGTLLALNVKAPEQSSTHLPLIDGDKDGFSPDWSYRGSQWRGKDCDDIDSVVYPGRLANKYGGLVDHNCNGIVGISSSFEAYEDQYCGAYPPRGLISLGDSGTAHFSIPPAMLTPGIINNTTYAGLLDLVDNEADWPFCSWGTAHPNTTTPCPSSTLPLNSVYQRMLSRNQCMFRDYQNIGVNGANSQNIDPTQGGFLGEFTRSQGGTDQPVTVIYALIGNDVCGARLFDPTPMAKFQNATMNSLHYLDSRLPPGSDVIVVGLVDGRILYETMSQLIHPIGTTYENLYNYLNCLEVSPCAGWMNSNETIRNMTTGYAMEFNEWYTEMAATTNFTNFNLAYVTPDFTSIVSKWVAGGGLASDLIEHTDGFHPSQTGNMLLAEFIWDFIEANAPRAMGIINPNNEAIIAQFGDQGGY